MTTPPVLRFPHGIPDDESKERDAIDPKEEVLGHPELIKITRKFKEGDVLYNAVFIFKKSMTREERLAKIEEQMPHIKSCIKSFSLGKKKSKSPDKPPILTQKLTIYEDGAVKRTYAKEGYLGVFEQTVDAETTKKRLNKLKKTAATVFPASIPPKSAPTSTSTSDSKQEPKSPPASTSPPPSSTASSKPLRAPSAPPSGPSSTLTEPPSSEVLGDDGWGEDP